jgi:hypothetical protein
MLNEWQSMPPAGPANGRQLKLVAPTIADQSFFGSLSISRPAHRGIYPIQ